MMMKTPRKIEIRVYTDGICTDSFETFGTMIEKEESRISITSGLYKEIRFRIF